MVEGQEPPAKDWKKKKKPTVRKRKEVFIYGNYRNYYGYRIDRNLSEDPRLAVLKREWFEGKDCLDVGCNQGLVTIGVAKKFSCRSILGIDIDRGLIETAKWNLKNIARKEKMSCRSSKVLDSGISNGGGCSSPDMFEASKDGTCKSVGGASLLEESSPLAKVSFECKNFVESLHGCYEKYDTILCLSVAKWIHLNWGDDGLITLFVKIWRFLRPGGILILEPQPWSSYKRNRLVSETAKVNFSKILFNPALFREILLDKVGFRSAEDVTDNLSGSISGFNRPITVFYK
ncbi:7SK snRNA methylphosphate capping enzyme protein [Dioscorea alata]|uniref:7SK snRNA methylphosphate capping enzyme protein n=3 Tax=Dioscorea alata TaxID=55571 RepID=A0ACB7TUR0_DIOAL|nr:7SK snRNA methylphosphate capping enzyme protein [Dioscorea alata]KAH7651734.1 7SK snRNA methylphosphate capping enzyme protein [Dioscorea alata]KAH7651735.1 7SK snRNA methylphosphate capping enzyme protein [Dioscorea alata]